MRLAFSTRNVRLSSFLELCNYARDYGFDGFEVDDVQTERQLHQDSLFRSGSASDARRKLRNRGISVSALNCAAPLDGDVTADEILRLLDIAIFAGVETLIVRSDLSEDAAFLKEKLSKALLKAEETGVEILFETSGPFSDSEKLIELINAFGSTAIGAAWDVRKTCFTAGESVQTTIKTLGAYIRYVRLGDMKDGRKVLIGDGDLPVQDFLNALRALNYEGFVCASWNDEIDDPDIVLTHFASFLTRIETADRPKKQLYYNRAKTGTYPWRQYETVDLTFPEVLDVMAETYPDQYAFKYTTLEYTRTYAEFRRDVDRVAASFIALGVKPGYHVAIWATNVPSWYLSFWAATKIGAVLVTVNTAYKVHEIEYLLQQSDTHTLVMIESSKDANYREIINELCPELKGHEPGKPLYSKKLPFLRNVITDGFSMEGALTWDEMLLLSDTV
ncbi:MAG: AMP-binding protein, partial [Lachnospiraceae bacterium]|nr:AMP-binding protein [Lachnospiraceae bacterium]